MVQSSLAELNRHESTAKTTKTTSVSTRTSDGTTVQTESTVTQINFLYASLHNNGMSNSGVVTPRAINGLKRPHRHAFVPRVAAFDRDNPHSRVDPFRGFYTLFWIALALGAVRTGISHYGEQGVFWGMTFARLITEDAKALALSDAVMIASTFLCVPYVKLINSGWIRYHYLGLVLQHVIQAAFLGLSIRWTFYRHWPWVQSGFMTLHTLAMLMKIHSYISHNGELSEKAIQLSKLQLKLDDILVKFGGDEKVELEARLAWEKEVINARSSGTTESDGGTGTVTPSDEQISPRSLAFEQNVEAVLEVEGEAGDQDKKERAKSTAARFGHEAALLLSVEKAEGVEGLRKRSRARREDSSRREQSLPPRARYVPTKGLEVLTWHSEEAISNLAIAMLELKDTLVSQGVAKIPFPTNVTYANFWDFLLIPTLVYQLEYPRTETIRPMYILEKVLALFGTFSLVILIVEHYIIPVMPDANDKSFLVSALDLAIPFMVNYLLIFYIIFECVCGIFAEMTRFADREFYQEWWNSTSFDEFSRRWNVPVHAFLLRHVYASTITTYRLSKFQAAFFTFLLSALIHELVMAVVTKKIRFYLFAMQMCQLPLIMVGRAAFFKRHAALGNLFFWIGLLAGFPLLGVCYIRF